MATWDRRRPAKVFLRFTVTIDEESWRMIWDLADREDLGGKGFSAALRHILNEWKAMQIQAGKWPHDPTGDQA